MSRSIRIDDTEGARDFRPDDFPLSLGVGDSAALQLPGVEAEGVCAFLGLADGIPFIQPGEDTKVLRNLEQIFDSCWLYNGDTVQIENARILCQISGDSLVFRIETVQDEQAIPPRVQPP